jgi:hypothetical protein
MGEGRTDQVLSSGAMDIDVALIGIDPRPLVDPLFEALEPQDAGQDEIIAVLLVVPVFACIFTVPEYPARWRACPVLLYNPVQSERGFERVLPVAVPEAGRRAEILFDNRIIPADKEPLLLYGDHEKKVFRSS